MQLKSVGEVIATRTLFLSSDRTRRVLVKMGKPQPLPDAVGALGSDCYCPFQITGIGDEKVGYGAGVDAFQSLELGLKMIGMNLAYLNREHNGDLRWDGDESGGLGFPFPEGFRD